MERCLRGQQMGYKSGNTPTWASEVLVSNLVIFHFSILICHVAVLDYRKLSSIWHLVVMDEPPIDLQKSFRWDAFQSICLMIRIGFLIKVT